MRHRIAYALIALMVLAGCGADPLAHLGQRSRAFFDLERTPTTPPEPSASVTTLPGKQETLRGLDPVDWYNQDDPIWGATGLRNLDPDQVVSVLWAQSTRRDRFVQSGPGEIAAALPGIGFPVLLPESVRHISSQLVFDQATGQLAETYQAAFGFWVVVPYTESRELGQRASLWVGSADLAVSYEDPGEGRLACPDLGLAEARACRPTPIGTLVGWWYLVPEGGTLVWFDGPYRYELVLRSTEDPALVVRMAESMQPLADLAP